MNCEQVIALLSAFYDRELPSDQTTEVEQHLDICHRCQEEFAAFGSITNLVRSSPVPEPPQKLAADVEERLARDRDGSPELRTRRRWFIGTVAVVASILLLIIAWQNWPGHVAHDHRWMVSSFSRFLDSYLSGDPEASLILPRQFKGRVVDLAGASEFLRRPSVAAPTLLTNHNVKERYALKMPRCDCVQTNYACKGKLSLVIFEHTAEQGEWFGNRPQIRCECAGKSSCLVETGKKLAAIWPLERGYVTVVGLEDLAEVSAIVKEMKGLTPTDH